jgi:CubicO group peptidase (beta-lactamase class C family)
MPADLSDALAFARDSETRMPRDLAAFLREHNRDEGVHGAITGPLLPRGDSTGVVLRRGECIARWGAPEQPGVCFSLTKCFVSALAGVAVADGLIGLDDRVAASVPGPWFTGAHNGAITWRHLLQLTSEWRGTLFGKPDAVDWHRVAGGAAPAGTPRKGSARVLQAPGTHWEYNDVRMNALVLALTHVLARALPEVLKARVMDPIGASDEWSWHGYDDAFVKVGDRVLPSVAAGAHWGGGVFASAFDLARLGELYRRRGEWNGRAVLPVSWVDACISPGDVNRSYGMLWWLNEEGAFEGLPRGSFWGGGLGGHLLWIDPAHELVVVTRWIEQERRVPLLRRIVAAIDTETLA